MLTLDDIECWSYETTENHIQPVPIMSQEERSAWVELNNIRKLNKNEKEMLKALNKKMRFRAKYELS